MAGAFAKTRKATNILRPAIDVSFLARGLKILDLDTILYPIYSEIPHKADLTFINFPQKLLQIHSPNSAYAKRASWHVSY